MWNPVEKNSISVFHPSREVINQGQLDDNSPEAGCASKSPHTAVWTDYCSVVLCLYKFNFFDRISQC